MESNERNAPPKLLREAREAGMNEKQINDHFNLTHRLGHDQKFAEKELKIATKELRERR